MSPLPTRARRPERRRAATCHRTRARTAPQHAVLAQSRSLRLSELRREYQQRAEYQAQHKDDQDDRDLDLEVEQPGPKVEDAVGDHPGQQRAVRHRQGTKA